VPYEALFYRIALATWKNHNN